MATKSTDISTAYSAVYDFELEKADELKAVQEAIANNAKAVSDMLTSIVATFPEEAKSGSAYEVATAMLSAVTSTSYPNWQLTALRQKLKLDQAPVMTPTTTVTPTS